MTATHHRKERSPEETLDRIRAILTRARVPMYESHWGGLDGVLHSCRIEHASIPAFGTNGKGVTRPLALASAYAEFLERLQNLAVGGVWPGERYGLTELTFAFHDEVAADALAPSSIAHEVEALLVPGATPELRADFAAVLASDRYVPFYDVAGRRVRYLPQSALNAALGTNGMAAGNTPAEALAQALAEVLERYVLCAAYSEAPPALPTIPLTEILDLPERELVGCCEAAGYRIVLKDCTLGGRFPVLGMIILHPASGRIGWRLASDPDLRIAVQRLMTEAFQGHGAPGATPCPRDFDATPDPFSSHPAARQRERLNSVIDYSGRIPPGLVLDDGAAPRHLEAFHRGPLDNRRAAAFLVDRILGSGRNVYVRDVSFLGFPAYRVYVPGMSEVTPIDGGRTFRMQQETSIGSCLLRLHEASADQVLQAAAAIERIVEELPGCPPTFVVERLARLKLRPTSDLAGVRSVSFLLAMMFARGGDLGRAFHHLRRDRLQFTSTDDGGFQDCALAYLALRERNPAADVGRPLTQLFGASLAEEVVAHLGDPRRAFGDHVFPRCGDCAACPVRADCSFDELRELYGRLRGAMHESAIDQRRVEEVLA